MKKETVVLRSASPLSKIDQSQYHRKMSGKVRQGHKEQKNQLAMQHTDMILPYCECVKSVV